MADAGQRYGSGATGYGVTNYRPKSKKKSEPLSIVPRDITRPKSGDSSFIAKKIHDLKQSQTALQDPPMPFHSVTNKEKRKHYAETRRKRDKERRKQRQDKDDYNDVSGD